MTHTFHAAFTVLLWCLCCSVSAGELAYSCEVRHLYGIEKNGSLKTSPVSKLENLMKGTSFSVSRETGALIGNSASLDTSQAKSVRVINRGSRENSFAAVADFGEFKNGTHPYQLLEIEEFREGELKPFVLMGVNGIVTGMCR